MLAPLRRPMKPGDVRDIKEMFQQSWDVSAGSLGQDMAGQDLGTTQTPRPLHHVTFQAFAES